MHYKYTQHHILINICGYKSFSILLSSFIASPSNIIAFSQWLCSTMSRHVWKIIIRQPTIMFQPAQNCILMSENCFIGATWKNHSIICQREIYSCALWQIKYMPIRMGWLHSICINKKSFRLTKSRFLPRDENFLIFWKNSKMFF
jgi:hypothetical protein